ncbi:hypothetical protein [Streptomyces sp. KR80]|uniref:hypothetical protein n=1 Tax=Streptomyces sp. KR80 TaxID=3457426 RepID=UPI003FD40246
MDPGHPAAELLTQTGDDVKKFQQAARTSAIAGAAGLFALTAAVGTGIGWPHTGRSPQAAAALDVGWSAPAALQAGPVGSPDDIDWP